LFYNVFLPVTDSKSSVGNNVGVGFPLPHHKAISNSPTKSKISSETRLNAGFSSLRRQRSLARTDCTLKFGGPAPGSGRGAESCASLGGSARKVFMREGKARWNDSLSFFLRNSLNDRAEACMVNALDDIPLKFDQMFELRRD
jgi:hypothetical protein